MLGAICHEPLKNLHSGRGSNPEAFDLKAAWTAGQYKNVSST